MSQIPSWDGFMAPVLRIQSDGGVRVLRDLITAVSDAVGLTPDQREEFLSSGQQVVANRIGWATSYLTRVGALERPSRGKYVITDFGRKFLGRHPNGIAEADLRAVAKPDDEWWVSKTKPPKGDDTAANVILPDASPLDPVGDC